MSIMDKIRAKRQEIKENMIITRMTMKDKLKDGWGQLKDFLLVLFLLNMLIGLLKQIEIAELRNDTSVKAIVIENPLNGDKNPVRMASADSSQPTDAPDNRVKLFDRDIEDIVDMIGQAESQNGNATYGLSKTCQLKGMSNNYGYNPPSCFKNDNEAREAVKWQLKKWEDSGLSLEQSLCLYNTGEIMDECEYLVNFI